MNTIFPQHFAQAYGQNNYSSSVYSCADNVTAPECVQASAPSAPSTGFFSNQPIFIVASFVLLAVVLYTITLLALKKVHRKNTDRG